MSQVFETIYRSEVRPPWDRDAPADFVVELAEAGRFGGEVLDAGCGTGENALYLAGRGHRVVGVDGAATAIARARAKAEARGLAVTWVTADARALGFAARFDTVLDCGLFHVFDDAADRAAYAAALARAARPGARLHLYCFQDDPANQFLGARPAGCGTHGVTLRELEEAFGRDWRIEAVETRSATLTTGPAAGERVFWLARLIRR